VAAKLARLVVVYASERFREIGLRRWVIRELPVTNNRRHLLLLPSAFSFCFCLSVSLAASLSVLYVLSKFIVVISY